MIPLIKFLRHNHPTRVLVKPKTYRHKLMHRVNQILAPHLLVSSVEVLLSYKLCRNGLKVTAWKIRKSAESAGIFFILDKLRSFEFLN